MSVGATLEMPVGLSDARNLLVTGHRPEPSVKSAVQTVFLLDPVGGQLSYGPRLAEQFGCPHIDAKPLLVQYRERPIPAVIVLDVVRKALQRYTDGPVVLTSCPRDCQEAVQLEAECAKPPIVIAVRYATWEEAEHAAKSEGELPDGKRLDLQLLYAKAEGICHYYTALRRLHSIPANLSPAEIERRALEILIQQIPRSVSTC